MRKNKIVSTLSYVMLFILGFQILDAVFWACWNAVGTGNVPISLTRLVFPIYLLIVNSNGVTTSEYLVATNNAVMISIFYCLAIFYVPRGDTDNIKSNVAAKFLLVAAILKVAEIICFFYFCFEYLDGISGVGIYQIALNAFIAACSLIIAVGLIIWFVKGDRVFGSGVVDNLSGKYEDILENSKEHGNSSKKKAYIELRRKINELNKDLNELKISKEEFEKSKLDLVEKFEKEYEQH